MKRMQRVEHQGQADEDDERDAQQQKDALLALEVFLEEHPFHARRS